MYAPMFSSSFSWPTTWRHFTGCTNKKTVSRLLQHPTGIKPTEIYFREILGLTYGARIYKNIKSYCVSNLAGGRSWHPIKSSKKMAECPQTRWPLSKTIICPQIIVRVCFGWDTWGSRGYRSHNRPDVERQANPSNLLPRRAECMLPPQ